MGLHAKWLALEHNDKVCDMLVLGLLFVLGLSFDNPKTKKP